MLSLAKRLQASIVLIEDASARFVAEALGFNSKGTIYVILKAVAADIIPISEAKRLLIELISAGFWLSSELLGKILTELS